MNKRHACDQSACLINWAQFMQRFRLPREISRQFANTNAAIFANNLTTLRIHQHNIVTTSLLKSQTEHERKENSKIDSASEGRKGRTTNWMPKFAEKSSIEEAKEAMKFAVQEPWIFSRVHRLDHQRKALLSMAFDSIMYWIHSDCKQASKQANERRRQRLICWITCLRSLCTNTTSSFLAANKTNKLQFDCFTSNLVDLTVFESIMHLQQMRQKLFAWRTPTHSVEECQVEWVNELIRRILSPEIECNEISFPHFV